MGFYQAGINYWLRNMGFYPALIILRLRNMGFYQKGIESLN